MDELLSTVLGYWCINVFWLEFGWVVSVSTRMIFHPCMISLKKELSVWTSVSFDWLSLYVRTSSQLRRSQPHPVYCFSLPTIFWKESSFSISSGVTPSPIGATSFASPVKDKSLPGYSREPLLLFGLSLAFAYDLVSFPVATCYWMHVVVVWVTGDAHNLLTFIRSIPPVVIPISGTGLSTVREEDGSLVANGSTSLDGFLVEGCSNKKDLKENQLDFTFSEEEYEKYSPSSPAPATPVILASPKGANLDPSKTENVVVGHSTRACYKSQVYIRLVEKIGLANVATMNNAKGSVFTRLSPPVDAPTVPTVPSVAQDEQQCNQATSIGSKGWETVRKRKNSNGNKHHSPSSKTLPVESSQPPQ
ncbi:hypothetical protein POTOM_049381 [Populus tomentosa]|uniref:Uncharacterized protein n=1 Tax=Populus tomentosa TaxID=118781 RepID=A0A8X8CAC4_POPTO|nr:hypothetical protein POTOM_049381 [Populus tomentosa]